MKEISQRILFFDGHCNLCNGFINFVVSKDSQRLIYIASIQGKTGCEKLTVDEINKLSTVILLESDGTKYDKSRAVLRVFYHLGGAWRGLSFFRFLPKFLTDFFYDLVAKNRYRLFGRKEICRLPTDQERAYFLD